MSDDNFSSLLKKSPASVEELGELARAALAEQREDEALALLEAASRTSNDPRLWQWKGLLERALDEHTAALKSLTRAADLAPTDASIAHGHARVALEAGIPAVDLFARAFRLAPGDASVYLGMNAARMAEGRGDEAEAELDRVLLGSPLWLDGHHQLAQFRSLLGRPERAFDPLERAIHGKPDEIGLWHALFELHLQAEDYALLDRAIERARASGIPAPATRTYEFIAASELARTSMADALMTDGDPTAIPPVWIVRHHLRSGRVERASALIEAELSGAAAADMWPYAAIAWRITGDPRSDWLTGDPNLVSVVDLSKELAAIPGLADILRALHATKGRYLNQSVRGGTQTDGPLFSRIEPEIRTLRALVVRAIEYHSTGLAALPVSHPQKKSQAGARVRFSGSWSVRLVGGGYHSNHVHPQGWISSALYVSLPEQLDQGEPFGGWLALGEPPAELGLDLAPTKLVQPRVGQLVLFPSWMWHGTRRFSQGERLTMAFDVAPPA